MITIVNLKTNITGQVADHIGMDDKLLKSQGYARIQLTEIPVYVNHSVDADNTKVTFEQDLSDVIPTSEQAPVKRRRKRTNK